MLSGEVRYTRNWSEVEAFVTQIFEEPENGVRPKNEDAE